MSVYAGEDPRLLKLALTFVKGMSADVVHRIEEVGLSLDEFFTLDMRELSETLGCSGWLRMENLGRQEAVFRSRKELRFIDSHRIHFYSLLDDDYPMLLSEIPDAPVSLFKLGRAGLDGEHIMDIVGTRKATPYGLVFCRDLVHDLAGYFPDLTVVSGLAYGTDAAAHEASLENGVTTVAVVAHGLDTIYPAPHRDLAKSILQAGGAIVSEYPSGVPSHRQNFLARNRVIAGLSEVTVVIESEVKGGAMSTANSAFNYNREVMALPGRVSDEKSAGCNHLIHREKAHLLTSAADVIEQMGWKPLGLTLKPAQRNLFPELEGDAARIYELLKSRMTPVAVDELHIATELPVSSLMATLCELEFDGVIVKHSGNRYSIA